MNINIVRVFASCLLLYSIDNIYADNRIDTTKSSNPYDSIRKEFSKKIQEEMAAICANPNLKALQSDKELMMKSIMGKLLVSPVATSCDQVKCDSAIFSEKLIDCNKVFACSQVSKELTCMPKSNERLKFSMNNLKPEIFEEFSKFYLEKSSNFPLYLARKNPNLFTCDVKKLSYSNSKAAIKADLTEEEFISYQEADKLLTEVPNSSKYSEELGKIENEEDFKKFLLANFYSTNPKNERRFLGYMLSRKDTVFKEFKKENFIENGRLNLNKVQEEIEKKYASFFCDMRNKMSDRLISLQSGLFSPISMKDQALISEILHFKAKKQKSIEDAPNFEAKIEGINQVCLLESMTLESFVGTDRTVESGSLIGRNGQKSSHDFAMLIGVDPTDINGQANETRLYTGSSSGSSNTTVDSDDSNAPKTKESSVVVSNSNIDSTQNNNTASSIDGIAASLNDIQNQMNPKEAPNSFNQIFNANYKPNAIDSDNKIKDNPETDSSASLSNRAFDDLSIEQLMKLKEQTQKEIQEKLQDKSPDKETDEPKNKLSNTDTGLSEISKLNPETVLLQKRLIELENRLKEKSLAESRPSASSYFKQAMGNNSKKKVAIANRDNQINSSANNQYQRNPQHNETPANSASSNTNYNQANIKLTSTKSISGQNPQSVGEKTLVDANIKPEMLDYIYQEISGNKDGAFILETTPGTYVEVLVEKDKLGNPILDNFGKPVFKLKPTSDKSKFGDRKISSLPANSTYLKRELKETKDVDKATRQIELNKLLKTNKVNK